MRDLVIKEIGTFLQSMGFRVDFSGDADIYVYETIKTNDGGHTGHSLELTIGIALDLEDQVILYYEKIAEESDMLANSGMGFDFGVDSEVQVGATTRRKITRMAQNAEGDIEEVSYDLGQIPEQIKAIAQKFNLKFKHVLSLKKIYGKSHQESNDTVMTNDRQQSQAQAQVNDIEQEAQVLTSSRPDIDNPSRPKKGLGILFILLWLLSVGFYGLLIFGEVVSNLGIMLVSGTHLLTFMVYMMFTNRRWVVGLVLIFAMSIVSFVSFSLTLPPSITEGYSTEQQANENKYVSDDALREPFFYDLGHKVEVVFTGDNVILDNKSTYTKVSMRVQIQQSLSLYQPLISEADFRPDRIVIKNLQLVKSPKTGTFANLTPLDGSPSYRPAVDGNSLIYFVDDHLDPLGEFHDAVSFQFEFADFAEFTFPAEATDFSSYEALKHLQLPESDYQFQVNYTLQVLTKDGAVYSSEVTTQFMPEGFLLDTTKNTYNTLGPALEEGADGTPLIKQP